MSEVLFSLALVACPVGMGLMMWFMMRGKKNGNEDNTPSSLSPNTDAELTKLRAEVDQLRASARDSERDPSTPPKTDAGSR